MQASTTILVARVFIAAIFILSGFGKLTDIAGTAGYFGHLGLPLPGLTAWLVGLLELVAGIALLVGFQTRAAALALAAFTIAASFIGHFDFADQMQTIMFLKNLAITGGLLLLASHGAGTLSLDARRA